MHTTVRRLAAALSAAALLGACSSAAHPAPDSSLPPVTVTPSTPAAAAPLAATPRTTAPSTAAPSTTTAPSTATAPTTTAPTTTAPTTTAPTTTAPSTAVATPAPSPDPCAGNTAAQQVLVSVRTQHLWMCAGHRLVRDTPVTTGIPGEDTHTPTGTYRVQARTRNTTLTLLSGKTYAVQYWIPFDAPLFGFHDSSWQDIPYGSQRYRTDGSHGCVHMPVRAIAFLYHWVHVGASVRIRA